MSASAAPADTGCSPVEHNDESTTGFGLKGPPTDDADDGMTFSMSSSVATSAPPTSTLLAELGVESSAIPRSFSWTDDAGEENCTLNNADAANKSSNKFKITARMVRRNMALTKGLAQDAERHLKMYTLPAEDGKEHEMFTFNVQSYFPECQSCSGLSARVKAILQKVDWSRTDEEIEVVRRFVMKLAYFNRYSLYVRQELAHVLFYDVFERGRVVIRQGDVGYSFYFIVSGSVLVQIQDKDPVSGVVRTNIVGELGAGGTFGDLALLNDDKRRATIVCKEDCEFLKVDKSDFKKILMESCRENWAHSSEILSGHELFRDWSEESLRLAVEGSQFVEFTSNSVVIKDLSEPSEHIFIVTKGKCQVVRKVSLLASGGRSQREPLRLNLPPRNATNDVTVQKCSDRKQQVPDASDQQEKGQGGKRCIQKWWLIRTLYPGDYFGIGEGPSNTSVICVDMAECLLINSIILAKQSQGRYLEATRNEAKTFYPTLEKAFKSYVEGKQWTEYKQRVLQQVLSDLRRRKTM